MRLSFSRRRYFNSLLVLLFALFTLTPTHASSSYNYGSNSDPSDPPSDSLVDASSTVSCAALEGQLSPTLQHGQMIRCTVECRLHSAPVMAVVTPFTFCSELTSTTADRNALHSRIAIGSATSPSTFCLAGSTVCSEMNTTSTSSPSSVGNSSSSPSSSNSTFAYGNIADVVVDSTTSTLAFSWYAPLVGSAAFLRVEIDGAPITNSPIIVLLSGNADGASGSASGGGGGSDDPSSGPGDSSSESVFAVGSRNFFIVLSFGVTLLLIVAVWLRSCVRAHQKHRELEVREERDKLWLQNVGAADMRAPFRSWYE